MHLCLYTHTHTMHTYLHTYTESTYTGIQNACFFRTWPTLQCRGCEIWPCSSYVERCRHICGLLHTCTHTQFISHSRIIPYFLAKKGVGEVEAFTGGCPVANSRKLLIRKTSTFPLNQLGSNPTHGALQI